MTTHEISFQSSSSRSSSNQPSNVRKLASAGKTVHTRAGRALALKRPPPIPRGVFLSAPGPRLWGNPGRHYGGATSAFPSKPNGLHYESLACAHLRALTRETQNRAFNVSLHFPYERERGCHRSRVGGGGKRRAHWSFGGRLLNRTSGREPPPPPMGY